MNLIHHLETFYPFPHKENKVSVKDIEQLKQRFSMKNIFSLPLDVEIDMPILTKKEVIHYREAIVSHLAEGKIGRAAVGIFLALYLLIAILFNSAFPTDYHFINCAGFIIGGVYVVKFILLAIAQIKIMKVMSEIEAKVKARRKSCIAKRASHLQKA